MDSLRTIVRDSEGGVILTVHVQPDSSRTECVGLHGNAVKIRVAARPVDGAANEELIRFIAERCSIPRSHIRIQSGESARQKRLSVQGVRAESLLARLMPGGSKGKVGR